MHRDAPGSPFRQPGRVITEERELWLATLQRDVARAHARTRGRVPAPQRLPDMTTSSAGSGGAPIVSGLGLAEIGEYFTTLGVGSSPAAHDYYMVMDTGSDVSWIQCAPCESCYSQLGSIFDPATSTSLRNISCHSPICGQTNPLLDFPDIHCPHRNTTDACAYHLVYGGGASSTGILVSDTVTLGPAMSVHNFVFGCGHDNQGLFRGAAGVLGLGAGKLSVPSQLAAPAFSYCLPGRYSAAISTLTFGPPPPSLLQGLIRYTPLLPSPILPGLHTFYFVSVTGISVAGNRLRIPASLFQMTSHSSGDGGVILDSGTAITRLPAEAYASLRSAYLKAATAAGFRPSATGGFSIFDTCFDLDHPTPLVQLPSATPSVVIHFQGEGADLTLPPTSTLVPVDHDTGRSSTKVCLAFTTRSNQESVSTIGNVQQQGFRLFFDRQASKLGIAPNQC